MNRQDIITSIAFSLLNKIGEKVKYELLVCDESDLFRYYFTIGVIIRKDYLPQYSWQGDTYEIVHDILKEMSNILKSGVKDF